MENDLDNQDIEFQEDNLTNKLYEFQDDQVCLDSFLDEIEKIDDLETLDRIQGMLLSKKQNYTEALENTSHLNVEQKDENNGNKCFIKELDEVLNEEQQKSENLMEKIRLKQEQVDAVLAQQVDDLDQFELQVSTKTNQLATAPKQYENGYLKKKIFHCNKIIDERKGDLQRCMENLRIAQKRFEEAVEMESMDLPLTVFDDCITTITSLKENLTQSLQEMSNEADKLHFEKMTANFMRKSSLYKN